MRIRLPTRKEIHIAFIQGEEAIVELILGLEIPLDELAKHLETQAAALQELQARLGKNSQNSSKPPSSDGYGKLRRTISLRQSGQKPNGGQPGHPGQTLERSAHPDQLEIHPVVACAACGMALGSVETTDSEER